MAAGLAPIRANKARYFADRQFDARLLPPPDPLLVSGRATLSNHWTQMPPIVATSNVDRVAPLGTANEQGGEACATDGEIDMPVPPIAKDTADAAIRREPGLGEQVEIVAKPSLHSEFEFDTQGDPENLVARRRLQDRVSGLARQASLDPSDGIEP